MGQDKEKANSNNFKSPGKRNSKFTNCSSRENDKKRKKLMRSDDRKEQLKKR